MKFNNGGQFQKKCGTFAVSVDQAIKRCLLIGGVLIPSVVMAAPSSLRFSGRLTDSNGRPFAKGEVRVKFSIYDAKEAGALVDQFEEQTVTTNDTGLFSADISPINSTTFRHHDELFLQIHVRDTAGYKALSPRQKLGTVLYAIQAEYSVMAGSATWIPDDSVTSQKIKDGSIASTDLSTASVGGAQLIDGSVGSQKMSVGAVQSQHIADGQVWDVDLASFSVQSGNILDGSIQAVDVASHSIASHHIQDGAVLNKALGIGAVSSVNIQDGAVEKRHIDPSGFSGLIPSGLIAMFANLNEGCPEGWTVFGGLNDRFPIGVSTYNGAFVGSKMITGLKTENSGAHQHPLPDHLHAVDLTTDWEPVGNRTKGDQNGWATSNAHDHKVTGNTKNTSISMTVSGNHVHNVISDGSWLPPALGVVFCRKN